MATSRTTMPVPTMEKASNGLKWRPSPTDTPTETTKAVRRPHWGVRWLWCTVEKKRGNAPMRPMAKAVRVEAVTPALELAMVEFTIARKTNSQKIPYDAVAMPCQDEAPALLKDANLPGPNTTSAA